MTVQIKIEKNESDEYEVQYIENGIKNEAKTYYTDDKEDAELTQMSMLRELKGQPGNPNWDDFGNKYK